MPVVPPQPLSLAPGARVCVTGGLGFVGVHLCEELRRRGYEVVAVDRLSGRYARGFGESAVPRLRAAGIAVETIDVAQASFADVVAEIDAVVHLAGLSGVSASHCPREFRDQNVALTHRLLDLADGRRVLLGSASAVYGDAGLRRCTEMLRRRPVNAYGASKAAAEDACFAAANHGADALVARLFTVYGPGQRPDMAFAAWIERMARGEPIDWSARPAARRDFTFVDDAVRGLAAALERGRAGSAYNVAGGTPVRLERALAELETAIGRRARRRLVPNGTAVARVTAGCPLRAARELGYRASTSLGEGIRAQVAAAVAPV